MALRLLFLLDDLAKVRLVAEATHAVEVTLAFSLCANLEPVGLLNLAGCGEVAVANCRYSPHGGNDR